MSVPAVKRKGRPPKEVVKKAKAPVGRPRGDNSAIEEFKQRLLASPRSKKVFDSILNAALDDNHKNQAAAWKLLADRLLPVSYFEKNASSGRPAVNITISGIGGETVSIDDNADEDEWDVVDVEEKNPDGRKHNGQ